MKRTAFCIITLFLVTLPTYADFSVGMEYAQVDRDLSVDSADVGSDSSETLGAFLGFNWKTSIFYLKHVHEETKFDDLPLVYEKAQTTFDWNWNKKGAKEGNFINTSLGMTYTTYEIGSQIDHDFLGGFAGAGFTRFIAGPVFINARVRVHLFSSLQEEELFQVSGEDEDTKSFLGYEGQAALGFLFGRKFSWSIQVGYKFHEADFVGRFVDDSSQQAFLVMRIFVPSKE